MNALSFRHFLAAAMPDKVKELQAEWDAWNQSSVKPLWGNAKGDDDGAEPGTAEPTKRKRKNNQ